MQAMASTQPLKSFQKTVSYYHSCVILPSEQQQAHSEEIPRAPADKDRVWRRNHSRAVSQRGADVGRRPAGRAAHHHVLHRQNCQVRGGCTWQNPLHVEARCHRGLWRAVGSSQQVLRGPAETKTPLYAKADHINRGECK